MTEQEYDMLEIPVAEAAEAVGVPLRTVQWWLQTGQLEGRQTITGRWMVQVGNLRRLIIKLSERRKDGGRTLAHLEAWLEKHYGGKVA